MTQQFCTTYSQRARTPTNYKNVKSYVQDPVIGTLAHRAAVSPPYGGPSEHAIGSEDWWGLGEWGQGCGRCCGTLRKAHRGRAFSQRPRGERYIGRHAHLEEKNSQVVKESLFKSTNKIIFHIKGNPRSESLQAVLRVWVQRTSDGPSWLADALCLSSAVLEDQNRRWGWWIHTSSLHDVLCDIFRVVIIWSHHFECENTPELQKRPQSLWESCSCWSWRLKKEDLV